MAKQGMKHYYTKHGDKSAPTVPQISGKAKSGKEKARPLIAGEKENSGKVYHATPHASFGVTDNDLAIENIANDFDLTAADLQDFGKHSD